MTLLSVGRVVKSVKGMKSGKGAHQPIQFKNYLHNAGVFFRRLRKKLKQNKTQTQGIFQKNSRIFWKNSSMTSLLLSNNDVIRQIFTKKLKENPRKRAKNSRRSSKTHCPAKLLFPIGRKIAEKKTLSYAHFSGPFHMQNSGI